MNSFRNHRLRDFAVPMSTNWLLNDIAEAKGKQELYTRQSPQMLKALREMALVQSIESSNRIEGVTVAADRLRPLVLGNARPKDRSEQEITGYRIALNLIHTESGKAANHPRLAAPPAQPLPGRQRRRRAVQEVDNEVIELRPGAAPVIRFKCVSAKATPAAVDELCLVYRHAIDQDHIPPLVAIGALMLDFLCIHPFRDGNGRVSRLLALLALYQHGYEVGRYISLERLVEEAKEDYTKCSTKFATLARRQTRTAAVAEPAPRRRPPRLRRVRATRRKRQIQTRGQSGTRHHRDSPATRRLSAF